MKTNKNITAMLLMASVNLYGHEICISNNSDSSVSIHVQWSNLFTDKQEFVIPKNTKNFVIKSSDTSDELLLIVVKSLKEEKMQPYFQPIENQELFGTIVGLIAGAGFFYNQSSILNGLSYLIKRAEHKNSVRTPIKWYTSLFGGFVLSYNLIGCLLGRLLYDVPSQQKIEKPTFGPELAYSHFIISSKKNQLSIQGYTSVEAYEADILI